MARHPKPRRWKPKNPEKYRGDLTRIIARSSWEIKFMNWCDSNTSVIEWSSEETIIPYISPLDGKPHRYFLDFRVKIKNNSGEIKTYMIEIKPKVQTLPPVAPKKKTKTFVEAVKTYAVNTSKWKAAKKYAEDRGSEFLILTEDNLF